MSKRNPMGDKVAIVGVGATAYGRRLDRSRLSLGLEAAKKAIRDAGLAKEDIDGIAGTGSGMFAVGEANFLALQEGLGIREITWCLNAEMTQGILHAAHAVFSGACETAVVVHAETRSPVLSASAQTEPLRVRAMEFQGAGVRPFGDYAQGWIHSGEPYAALAGRYLHEFGVPREVLGLIAINNRSNAVMNENAVLRTPITMDDYLSARMVRDPFGILDMDLPVDCGEAIVITTEERAQALPKKPVYIHAATFGEANRGTEYYENVGDYRAMSPWVAMAALWGKSDLTLDDIDIFFPYDGYTINAICFTEAAGYCQAGEAWDFFRENWDETSNRLKIGGKTLVTTNGGSLSHGRSSGFNYYTESVLQLRGEAGARQLAGCRATLIASGSLYHDPSVAILRTD